MGEGAWRLDLPPGANKTQVLAALKGAPRVHDVVVTDRHVMVTFDPDERPRGLEALIERAVPSRKKPREHVIRARYDGADLAAVARATGKTPDQVVTLHRSRVYTVEMIGFLPGFAYLGPLDPALLLPRRASPRPRVTPFSIGIAGGRTCVYPFASPGGWHLIGTAQGFPLFDEEKGATLALGDLVRFEHVRV
jgi:5-oxoprolinase (ATP-hydrolysing) subunit A